jgi:hypothetical protein
LQLLSVSELDSTGYKVIFENGLCDLWKGEEIILSTPEKNRLYEVETLDKRVTESTSTIGHGYVSKEVNSELWHRRLAHLNHTALKLLLGDAKEHAHWEVCIKSKHKRKIIWMPQRRATAPFQSVHSDTWGPFKHDSLSEKRYYILFVDDFTR